MLDVDSVAEPLQNIQRKGIESTSRYVRGYQQTTTDKLTRFEVDMTAHYQVTTLLLSNVT